MSGHGAQIKLYEPRLPAASDLKPYLDEIDAARRYSNAGPLLQRFEGRLADHFALPAGGVACVANGTLGLILALQAQAVEPGELCLMPSWTFAASAHAAFAAGLVPYFVDVDEKSWALTPSVARQALRGAPAHVGAVLPVAPFGAPFDGPAWDAFADETGVKVVIDAAAGYDGSRPSHTPVVVSLHATKALAVGEGGLVASADLRLIDIVRRLGNFGFGSIREAGMPAINAKMSEYTAAVGLAALDAWPEARACLAALTETYDGALAALPGVEPSPGFGAARVSSTCVVRLENLDTGSVGQLLGAHGVESRRWWRDGCHAQPAFSLCPSAPLPVTQRLAESTIGLPFHLGLDAPSIHRVVTSLAAAAETIARGGAESLGSLSAA